MKFCPMKASLSSSSGPEVASTLEEMIVIPFDLASLSTPTNALLSTREVINASGLRPSAARILATCCSIEPSVCTKMNCPFAPTLAQASSKPSLTACQNELVVAEWQVNTMLSASAADADPASINKSASAPTLSTRPDDRGNLGGIIDTTFWAGAPRASRNDYVPGSPQRGEAANQTDGIRCNDVS